MQVPLRFTGVRLGRVGDDHRTVVDPESFVQPVSMAATPKLEFRDRARHPTCSSRRTTTKRQLREEIIYAAIELFADSGADLDTTATSRAVVGMIFGLAMIGLNPAVNTFRVSAGRFAYLRPVFPQLRPISAEGSISRQLH
jgi:hypothetical protein